MEYKVSLSAVVIPESAKRLISEALDKGMVGQSEYVELFEQQIAEFVGAKFCVAVSSGTMADAVLVAAMKEAYGISRVVVPALTFIAQPNSVRYNGLDVVFEDVGEDWLLDTRKYYRENDISEETLIFHTDTMGRPLRDLSVLDHEIEDACEAFGSQNHYGFAGTVGIGGTFSFFPSHTISTGEGGAIVTNNQRVYNLCKRMRAHGTSSDDPIEKFTFPYFGFNARMTTMQACLGIALMQNIEEYIQKRIEIFNLMESRFGVFDCEDDEIVVPHAYPLYYSTEEKRDIVLRRLIENGIECRKFFSCIPRKEKQYLESKRYPVAEKIASTHLYLPCHQNMTPDDVEYIFRTLEEIEKEL